MRDRLTGLGGLLLGLARRVAAFGRRKSTAFSELWRHSLQFRVTVSTLAMSAAVVFVLGMVLQNQITDRLMTTKEDAATAQLDAVVRTVESELVGDAGQDDALRERLTNAVNRITTSSVAAQDASSSAAGTFEPVLAAGDPERPASRTISAGPYDKVSDRLRGFVENNTPAKEFHTADGTTYLAIGAPITTTTRPLQVYLLFPLTSEQNTVATVQNTLVVGSFALLALLAGITNIVVRQVVQPVRRAAGAAEQFAHGELDRRLEVIGEDDLSKLAVAYNEMAASIQRQIRQLEEFGELQRRFTSDVSHELRTPLTTVRMAADVLHASREQFPAGLARSTELLTDELDRFEQLLADLLEISRLDAGVEELSSELTDVRPIAQRAAEQVSGLAESMGSPIEVDLPDSPVEAEVDARRIERILRNLLANAVDHGEGRPVRLRLAATEPEVPAAAEAVDDTAGEGGDAAESLGPAEWPGAVAITIRDQGVGLRPGESELVFNRFWRADPSRNRRTGGTGLGLAISQEDARLHGGTLDAWGEPDRGSCFRLTLPRRVGGAYTANPLPLPPEDARPAADAEGDRDVRTDLRPGETV
ncbi:MULTISPECIES: sensor histidine kinase [Prauserella salsuginis group]|uniref:histidine kinase n=2 Tax=Prauserella salsuginis group TaxID=2893672 RepID=A0A839XPS7_9PSEU|nr:MULTISPECIES: HAMP domain-containing sensor histidine kinase [Prauserella salsuginis group]MBB3663909.1 two-component system sensor histidine kinase MtrB [Prauserella sediminis]MCR3721366.1 two-component system, OmpR family, sensor histidine kinase MtrB [Prauserella flava]MCR3732357.1 two-component system, OmpR family, sensor histidine kinase MtrB [Prauserella salsuginis]